MDSPLLTPTKSPASSPEYSMSGAESHATAVEYNEAGDSVKADSSTNCVDETRIIIDHLRDPERSNPCAADLHDEILRNYYLGHSVLPACCPARYMHVLDHPKLLESADRTTAYVRPRMCDVVATVMWETSEQCLENFVNGEVEVFEWRQFIKGMPESSTTVVRREGNKVWVGIYRRQGYHLVWSDYVCSSISHTGSWTEVYAGKEGYMLCAGSQMDYNVLTRQAAMKKADHEDKAFGDNPQYPKYALFMGRQLGYILLQNRNPTHAESSALTVEWEADGKITEGVVKG